MEYPNEIKITNFNMHANFYRNARRPEVDNLFNKKEELSIKAKEIKGSEKEKLSNEIKDLDHKARQLWREIIAKAEKL